LENLSPKLQKFILKWIDLEIRLTRDKDKKQELKNTRHNIETINQPWRFVIGDAYLSPRDQKYIEHYVPIDWTQRRIDFLNEPIPEESQAWTKMGREEFLDTANPLTPDEQTWLSMSLDEFYEALRQEI
jgi:hypothetical protein